jgi:hypothetical protein
MQQVAAKARHAPFRIDLFSREWGLSSRWMTWKAGLASKCTLGLHYVGLETNLTPERTGRTVTRRTRFLGESGPYYAEGQYSDARWSLEAPL